MKKKYIAIVLISMGFFSACSTVSDKMSAYRDNTPDLDDQDIAEFVTKQNAALDQFVKLAGVDPSADSEQNWRPVVEAGIHYVDVRCDRFMDALFWFNRVREASSRQVQYMGAATAAALALLNASKELIGLSPLGFTLADQTINNVGKGLLYDLNPSTVRSLVEKQQTTYVDATKEVIYQSKPVALRTIQNYAALCLPASIETEVNRSIENAEYKATNILVPIKVETEQGDREVEPPSPAPVGIVANPFSQPTITPSEPLTDVVPNLTQVEPQL